MNREGRQGPAGRTFVLSLLKVGAEGFGREPT